jgi:hypothetical protein
VGRAATASRLRASRGHGRSTPSVWVNNSSCTAARASRLVDRFQAGDGFAEIANDFGVPTAEVEDVIRVALRLTPEFFIDRSLGR